MRSVDAIFREELNRRGVQYVVTAEGLYELQNSGGGNNKVTVSLENIRRDYERDGDAKAVVRFVDQVSTDLFADAPNWEKARPFVRYSLEPADHVTGFDGVLLNATTPELKQIFVYTNAEGSRITWINESLLGEWGVTREQVTRQAEENMAAIVAKTKFEVDEIQGNKLGMLVTGETPFKASLILSPAFRDLVSPTHGWPVYVVAPCRDFVFVIRQDNRSFLSHVGRVVVDEYRKSGYPITKDVLQVSDSGITAIGTFPDTE